MSGFGKQSSSSGISLSCAVWLVVIVDVVMIWESLWSELVLPSQESQLEDERGENEQLKEEADLLRRKAQLLDQVSGSPSNKAEICRCCDNILQWYNLRDCEQLSA